MKQQTIKFFVVLSLALLLVASPVCASSTIVLEAGIPFDFTVGSKVFRAGDYTVERIGMGGVLLIRSADFRGSAMFFTYSVQAPHGQNHTKLVFRRYGDQYFLSQVWGGRDVGRELPKSGLEREVARRVTRKAVKPEQVEVAPR